MSIDDTIKQIDLVGDTDVATVFISDIHIPDGKSKHVELLDYLKERQKDIHKIILVGDILDLWVTSIDEALVAATPLFDFIYNNYPNKFHYLLGNHDAALLPLKKFFPFMHTSLQFPIGNKKAICLHGHVLDDNPYLKTKFSRFMAWLINKFDRWANIDTRKSLVSLSEQIQNDPYDKLIADYEQSIVDVFEGKFDYVITGHTHLFPYIKKLNDIVYINLGDSLQHSTLMMAKPEGFYLYDYIKCTTIDFYPIIT